MSGTNTRAGYACTGNAPIGLVGIRGKTCFGKTCLGGKIARTLRNFLDRAAHQNKFYRECQPIKCERYPCTRRQHGSLRLTREKKWFLPTYFNRCFGGQLYLENCSYLAQRGNWFLPPRKLIITTVEIDFYHHRKENVWFHLTSLLEPPSTINWCYVQRLFSIYFIR